MPPLLLPSLITRPLAVIVLPVPACLLSKRCVASVVTLSPAKTVPVRTGATSDTSVPLYTRVTLWAVTVKGALLITPVASGT